MHWGSSTSSALRSRLVFFLRSHQLHAVHRWQVFACRGECVLGVRIRQLLGSDWSHDVLSLRLVLGR